jgi:hypothetical protein
MVSVLPYLFGTPNYMKDPPAFFHPRILVGPGCFLNPYFAQKHDITHVINCAFDEDSPSWWRNHNPSKYKVLNAIDSVRTNILNWYPEFEKTMHEFLREGTGVVYVHCQAGMNRSGSLALAYTCKNLDMKFDELVASVKRQRPCILQNPVFMNQVKEFINGRVQDSENTGISFLQYHDRYARFFTPGNRPNSQGLQDQTGNPAPRNGGIAIGNITPMYLE